MSRAIPALVAVFAITSVWVSPAVAQVDRRPTDQQLVAAWQDANTRCRGGSGATAAVEVACRQREAISARLEARGYCYGKQNEYGFEAAWHRCTPTSCGIVDC